MQLSLGEIGVETKICEKLFSRGIDTVGQLLQCSKKELLQIPSFGEKVVEHLLERLNRIGIYKGMGPDVGDQS
jgi:DNA-directed RNA polymerase alpha subunit